MGITALPSTVSLDDRESIVAAMSLHYGVLCVKAELDQILCGLSDTLNTLDLVRGNPVVMKPFFLWKPRPPPTADYMYDLMTAKFSDAGSNRRDNEEAACMLWVDFLKVVEGMLLQL